MVVAQAPPAGSDLARTSRRECAYFGRDLRETAAADNLRLDEDRTSPYVRDPYRFFAA
jgi:hypothetical protein